MTDPRTIEQHGSRIIAALEHAWAAIQDTHPDVPDVVIVTGAGSNQKGTPEGYQLRGHHWPERWVLGGQDQPRAPELFIAGELLAAGGRAAVEVMLHEAAHAPATGAASKTPAPPATATDAYAEVTAGIDAARVSFLVDLASPGRPGGGDGTGDGGEDQGEDGPGQPAKRSGRRVAVECACLPEPRRLQLTPKQIEDGPILCGLCCAPSWAASAMTACWKASARSTPPWLPRSWSGSSRQQPPPPRSSHD